MKLDYATLISPYPLYLPNIGNIKSPTLKEIWHPDITYQRYNTYLSLLLTDLKTYCEKINPQRSEWFHSLSDEERLHFNIFDIILGDKELQEKYRQMLDFFFVENIFWDNCNHVYFTYIDKDKDDNIIPVGIIQKQIWHQLCDVILERCGVETNGTNNIDESKINNKRAMKILQKINSCKKKAQTNKEHDKDTELPNIISKVSIMAKSINYINIWDLTVFQLYEQFRQECTNVYFNIQTMSVAAWGNEKNTFKGNEWYKNEN